MKIAKSGLLVACVVAGLLFTFRVSPALAFGPGERGCTTGASECTEGDCGNAEIGCFCAGTIADGTGTCEAKRTAGAGCNEAGQCRSVLTCNLTPDTAGYLTCVAPASADESFCLATSDCPSGLSCVGATADAPGLCAAVAPTTPSTDAVSEEPAGPIRLYNPLGTDLNIPQFIGKAIRAVTGVVGAVALFMFVYGGIIWMTAGSSERIETAKTILKNSLIGIVLIFLSYSLISIFFDLFN